MTARTTPQANGTPTWLDFWSADIDDAAGFWADLLGHEIPPGSEEFGGYRMVQRNDRFAFGIGGAAPGQAQDQAALYLATDDVAATLGRAKELGATVVSEPMEIPGAGHMAVYTDPAGVMTALWQATDVVGYDVDEPGFPCWQDCLTGDVDASAAFLRDLFGFTTEPMAEGVLLGKLGDDGHFTIGAVASGEQPHWVSYLLVDDVDAMATKATGLGARVTMGPTDLPFGGRFVHLVTPGGAPFGFFAGDEEMREG